MEQIDIALLIIRLWVGTVMVLHGTNHARSIDGTASWFESVGFSSPKLNARVSALGEMTIGLAIAAGFLTSFAAAGLVAIMFVAFWTIHRFAGFFNFHRPDEGYEYVATLAIVGLFLAIIGPGAYSLDRSFGWTEQFDGAVGAVLIVLGLIAGFVQTLIFWKRPSEEEE